MNPDNGTPNRKHTARPWWRDGMIWLIICIVSMVVGINAIMVTMALRDSPGLVRADYYEASKEVNAEHAARMASARLGWQVRTVDEAATAASLRLRVTDAQGAPVTGLNGLAQAYRPSDATLDQALTWHYDPERPGEYAVVFDRPWPGLWRLSLDLSRDDLRLVHELPVVLPVR